MPGFKRITDLPTAGAIAGNELVEVSQPSATIRISAATISAAALDNSLNDSGSGFVTAGFLPGDRVQVAGFVTGGNNMIAGVIVSVTAGKIVIGGGPLLADEAAGTTVTIAKWTSRRIDLNSAVAATAAVQANTAKAGNATHTGEVTGSVALTIAAGVVTNSKLANMATGRLKGRLLGTTGSPQDLTGTEVTTLLDTFTSALKGLVPPPGTPSGAFLRDDGTWAVPAGGGGGGVGITEGDKGDITVSGLGEIWTIDADVVSNAKLANMPASTIKGNATGVSADPADLSGAQVALILPVFTSAAKGLAPASGGGTANFLRADGSWAAPPVSLSLTVNTRTANYTLTLADAGAYIRMNLGSSNDLIVPRDVSVPFPIGTVIHIRQVGAGRTAIVPFDGTVTVSTPETTNLRKQGSSAALIKVDTNSWDLTGDLELV